MSEGWGVGYRAPKRRRAGSRESSVDAKGGSGLVISMSGRPMRTASACAGRKKEKTLGPASMPKHEAQSKLADYIEEYTGRVAKQGNAIDAFADLWNAFSAVRSGRWSKKTKEDLRYLFAKHVLPSLGPQLAREVSLTSLQLLVNRIAEDGYGA
jgi:hypothetical protein